jgi:hypothetical protein
MNPLLVAWGFLALSLLLLPNLLLFLHLLDLPVFSLVSVLLWVKLMTMSSVLRSFGGLRVIRSVLWLLLDMGVILAQLLWMCCVLQARMGVRCVLRA